VAKVLREFDLELGHMNTGTKEVTGI